MATDWSKILVQLPKWALAFLAIVIAGVILYATAIAQCTTEIFGLGFGPKTGCGDRGSTIPPGIILAWDPIVRSADGTPTGQTRTLPSGWTVCDGKNGSPKLESRFLMGVLTNDDAGEVGGTNEIPGQGAHYHGGAATDLSYGQGQINWNRIAGKDDQFSHQHKIDYDGAHDHGGDNRPEYYSVVFLCKAKT